MMDETETLLALMDTLLPGGDGFPPASATGTAQMLGPRLRTADEALPGRLLAALTAQGQPPTDKAGWHAAVTRLEAVETKLFGELRKYAYLTYYEQPETIAAIQALGLLYNASPLPGGYPTEPFTAEHDAPRHSRGHWIATADVKPLDLAPLDLEEIR
jgi:hypothetical protein